MEKEIFRRLMAERRNYNKDSMDYEWRTAACRKYVLMMRNVPAIEWEKYLDR